MILRIRGSIVHCRRCGSPQSFRGAISRGIERKSLWHGRSGPMCDGHNVRMLLKRSLIHGNPTPNSKSKQSSRARTREMTGYWLCVIVERKYAAQRLAGEREELDTALTAQPHGKHLRICPLSSISHCTAWL